MRRKCSIIAIVSCTQIPDSDAAVLTTMKFIGRSFGLAVVVATAAAAPANGQGHAVVSPGAIRVTVPIGRRTESTWTWNHASTPDNVEEYRWQARIGTRYAFGFSLFKRPGSLPQSGSFEDLLRAGQADTWSIAGGSARVMRGVTPTLRGKADSLILELTHPLIVAEILRSDARQIVVESSSPYRARVSTTIPIRLDSAASRVTIGVGRVDSLSTAMRSLADSVAAVVDTIVVFPERLRLAAGDSIFLFMSMQLEGRDAQGGVVTGFIPLISAGPRERIRLRNGHLVAIAPGEAEVVVKFRGSPADSTKRDSRPLTRIPVVVDPPGSK